MRELEHPFDGQYIIGKKIKLRMQLKSDGAKRIQKKIAILGGSTRNDVKFCLELFLLNYPYNCDLKNVDFMDTLHLRPEKVLYEFFYIPLGG